MDSTWHYFYFPLKLGNTIAIFFNIEDKEIRKHQINGNQSSIPKKSF